MVVAIDALDGQFRLDRPRRPAAAAQAGDPALRIARVVDQADAQAFRHHLVDRVAELRRILAPQAAAVGDLADQDPTQLLG